MGTDAQPGMDHSPWQVEELLAHRYRVQECLRSSGSCWLYRAQDVFRGELQLLVRPSQHVLDKTGGAEWFERYAKAALAMPAHANALPCTRMDHAGNVPFLVMANVEGNCWDREINSGRLTGISPMLDIAMQTARLVAWLHDTGHVHGNIKPANFLVTATKVAKLWKYPQAGAKTRAYASPEQMAGQSPLEPATDVWSWAASILHMFVGKVSWRSPEDAPATLQRYMRRGPRRQGISLMPGPLAELLEHCMVADPSVRPASMDEVAGVLRDIIKTTTDESHDGFDTAIVRATGPLPEASVDGDAALPDEAIEANPLDDEGTGPSTPDSDADALLDSLIPDYELDGESDVASDADAVESDLDGEPDTDEQTGEEVEGGQPTPRVKRWTARRDNEGSHGRSPHGGGRNPHRR